MTITINFSLFEQLVHSQYTGKIEFRQRSVVIYPVMALKSLANKQSGEVS
jgi:hypothetical protein